MLKDKIIVVLNAKSNTVTNRTWKIGRKSGADVISSYGNLFHYTEVKVTVSKLGERSESRLEGQRSKIIAIASLFDGVGSIHTRD